MPPNVNHHLLGVYVLQVRTLHVPGAENFFDTGSSGFGKPGAIDAKLGALMELEERYTMT